MGPCRSRRDFLRIAGASLVAPLVGSPLRAAPTSRPTSPVSIARCKSYDREVLYRELAALMDQLGGLAKLASGKTVAVKVNLTGSPDQPALGLPPADLPDPPGCGPGRGHPARPGRRKRIRFLECTYQLGPFEPYLQRGRLGPERVLRP